MTKKLARAVLIGVLMAFPVGPSLGASLAPGTAQFRPDVGYGGTLYTAGLPAYFDAAHLVVSTVFPFTNVTNNLTGTVTSTVYRNDAGFLAFQYRFTSTGTRSVVRATIGDETNPWQNWSIVDCGIDTPPSGSSTAASGNPRWRDGTPKFLARDETSEGEGLVIQWRSPGGGGLEGTLLRAGNSSALIWFETNARLYRLTDVGVIDSGAVAAGRAYAPDIPEPATLALLGLGGLGLVLRRRRR